MVKAEFDSFFESRTVTVSERNAIECSLNLSEENAEKVLGVTGKVFQSTADVEDGFLVYGGLAAFNVVFLAEEITRVEAGTKFSFKTPMPEGECVFKGVEYSLYGLKVRNDGGMLYATAELVAEVTFIVTTERKFLVGADALVKRATMTQYAEKPFSSYFDAEENFRLKKIKRVIFSDANAYIKGARAGADVITVEGEVFFSVLALPFSENGDIIKEVRKIPFSYEVECLGADENCKVSACVKIEKILARVALDEQNNDCLLTAKINLGVYGSAFMATTTEYVDDCYSTKEELLLTRANTKVRTFSCHVSTTERLSERLNCTVPEYSRLIKVFGETVELSDFAADGGELKVDGVISGKALFDGNENETLSRPFDLPFSLKIPIDEKRVENVRVVADELVCKLRSGRLEAETTLYITFDEYRDEEVCVIRDVVSGEEKKPITSAVSVYIGCAGDDEWIVTKRLGVPVETIVSLNPDLTFPLKGGERLIVFRKL